MEPQDSRKTRNKLRVRYSVLLDFLSRISNKLHTKASMIESAAGLSACSYLLEDYGYDYKAIENMSEMERRQAYMNGAEVAQAEIEELKRIAAELSGELNIQVSENIDEWRASAAQKLINKES